jgi:transposase InsO family protein
MGSVGDAYDNALCESFFATLECELLDRVRFRTPAVARMAIFEFIEGWYNPHRRTRPSATCRPLPTIGAPWLGGRKALLLHPA